MHHGMQHGLRPGVTVFDVPGRGPAVRAAGGTLHGIALPPERVEELRAWFAAPSAEPPDDLCAALAAFDAAGHLGPRPVWPAERRRVAVLASDAVLAEQLVAGLGAAGALPEILPADADLPSLRPAAVCAVRHGPAPASWSDLDVLPAEGVAWQRASVEGRHLLLEPVADGPDGVAHADVRARRLAAAGSGHTHLGAYWAAAEPGPLDAGDRALIVALVVADLRAWATDRRDPVPGALVTAAVPARYRLRVVDLDSGAVADHPVLPVPASAP
jgi:hypothetical protein